MTLAIATVAQYEKIIEDNESLILIEQVKGTSYLLNTTLNFKSKSEREVFISMNLPLVVLQKLEKDGVAKYESIRNDEVYVWTLVRMRDNDDPKELNNEI